MSMYKVGDKVVIDPDLSTRGHDWEVGINDSMYEYAGQTATITAVKSYECHNGDSVYEIDLDAGCWSWQDSMFAGNAATNGVELPPTLMDKSIEYAFTPEEVETKAKEIRDLIGKYGYTYTIDATKKIVEENFKVKGWMIELFKKHPNYKDGKIILQKKVRRPLNKNEVRKARVWFIYRLRDMFKEKEMKIGLFKISEYLEAAERTGSIAGNMYDGSVYNGLTKEEWKREHNRMIRKYREFDNEYDICSMSLEEGSIYLSRKDYNDCKAAGEIIDYLLDDGLDSTCPELLNEKQIKYVTQRIERGVMSFKTKPTTGQKICKYLGKMFKHYGINKIVDMQTETWTNQDGNRQQRQKDMGYNYWFALLGDSINPTETEREVVLSVDIMDFLTMSFGHKWASCMTIDKGNLRGIGSSHYSGCYSGGTLSYGLDPSTFVCYIRPTKKELEGVGEADLPMYEQGKLKRCLFMMGEDKLVQSRVYPDGRDGGEEGIATQMRNIVQKVIADLYETSNMWTLKRGTSSCGSVIDTVSLSPHYRDYEQYGDCNVSYLRRVDGLLNRNHITVGALPICPDCGKRHHEQETITCSNCYNNEDVRHCDRCDDPVDENDAIYIEDSVYCCARCAELDGWVRTHDGDWESIDNCRRDDYDGDYYYDSGDGVEIGVCWYVFEEHAVADGWVYATIDEDWAREESVLYDEYKNEYFIFDLHPDFIETEDGLFFVDAESAIRGGYHESADGAWVEVGEEEETA